MLSTAMQILCEALRKCKYLEEIRACLSEAGYGHHRSLAQTLGQTLWQPPSGNCTQRQLSQRQGPAHISIHCIRELFSSLFTCHGHR